MSRNQFASLREVLGRTLGTIAKDTTGAAPLLPIWREVAGDALARQVRPDRLEHGTLTLLASGEAWSAAVKAASDQLLQRLHEALDPGRPYRDRRVRVLRVKVEQK